MVFLISVTLTELGRNGKLLMEQYHDEGVDRFINYEKNTQMLIDKLHLELNKDQRFEAGRKVNYWFDGRLLSRLF